MFDGSNHNLPPSDKMECISKLAATAVSRMSAEDVEKLLSTTPRPQFATQSWSLLRELCVGKMQNHHLRRPAHQLGVSRRADRPPKVQRRRRKSVRRHE